MPFDYQIDPSPKSPNNRCRRLLVFNKQIPRIESLQTHTHMHYLLRLFFCLRRLCRLHSLRSLLLLLRFLFEIGSKINASRVNPRSSTQLDNTPIFDGSVQQVHKIVVEIVIRENARLPNLLEEIIAIGRSTSYPLSTPLRRMRNVHRVSLHHHLVIIP